jgi:4'-phosphopantetheinyl transferase
MEITQLPLPEHMGVLYTCPVGGTQKEQSAAAHAMLESVLPAYAKDHGITLPDPLRFSEGENGKPFLPGCPSLHFNLSHCKGLALCLLSAFPCGVDAEPKRTLREKVVRRVCSASEKTALAAAEDKDLYFTRLWTLKEAYVKAIGIGISYPMKEVSFTIRGGAIRCSRSGAEFRQILYQGFAVSVCILR